MEENYVYPDVGDRCVGRFIDFYGPEEWEGEERWVLGKTLRLLRSRFPGGARLMMDIGCGEGRLTPIFAPIFREIVCADPDPTRLEVARRELARLGVGGVTFLNSAVPSLQLEEVADFILCSHVIQHIPTGLLQPFMDWIGSHLKAGGLTLLLFAKSTMGRSIFTVARPDGGGGRVSEEEFNRVFKEKNTLPVHKIPPRMVEELLDAAGMRIIREYSYHLGPRVPAMLRRPALALLGASRRLSRRVGIDHAMVAAKEEKA